MKFVSLPSPTAECKALVSAYTDLEEIILMDHTAVGQVLDQSVRQCRFTPVCDPSDADDELHPQTETGARRCAKSR